MTTLRTRPRTTASSPGSTFTLTVRVGGFAVEEPFRDRCLLAFTPRRGANRYPPDPLRQTPIPTDTAHSSGSVSPRLPASPFERRPEPSHGPPSHDADANDSDDQRAVEQENRFAGSARREYHHHHGERHDDVDRDHVDCEIGEEPAVEPAGALLRVRRSLRRPRRVGLPVHAVDIPVSSARPIDHLLSGSRHRCVGSAIRTIGSGRPGRRAPINHIPVYRTPGSTPARGPRRAAGSTVRPPQTISFEFYRIKP